MINSCTTLPILGYVINITCMFMDGSQENYTSNFINDILGSDMGVFNFNYSQLFNETLKPNSVCILTVIPTNMPSKLLIMYSYLHDFL